MVAARLLILIMSMIKHVIALIKNLKLQSFKIYVEHLISKVKVDTVLSKLNELIYIGD